ncbi:MAG: dihydrofolate reductase [Lachnospiraceae bacterium]|jgi:dihydrofolate reductase|nr:dihydrofolate reductase [Lachnospiraceae bacterium]MBQ2503405.1 dihydrofolate reductase [Lachnospiraceae bacterium]MBQ2532523.1 dihydrofolate reductase [Lachnospiraceae bacterium]MBR0430074.1 dihydrofolate reductase [Lachnospiraceae bacterium]SFT32281.1 dihydrofolate reductase [Lachnospiraceae bacterium XBD2001]
MKLIVAVDSNWGIGNKGKLLVSIPEDMKFFRGTTTGHVIVMGRKTLESFPNGNPLPNRTNIVLTRDKSFAKKGVIVVHDLDELDELLKEYKDEEVYCIGGESVYRQLLDRCDEAFVTMIDFAYEADAYFPDLTKEGWEMVGESEEQTYFDLCYTFTTWKKK